MISPFLALWRFLFMEARCASIIRSVVTIEILQRSQRTRPRIWIRNMGWIFFFPMAALVFAFICPLIPNFSLVTAINQYAVAFAGKTYLMFDFLKFFILPITLWVVGFFPLVLCHKMATYRHAYFFFYIPAIIIHIVYPIALTFLYLNEWVPSVSQIITRSIPAEILKLISDITGYVAPAYSALLLLVCFFAIFYNLNYPAKYEDIYAHRKARLKAYNSLDEKIAYKKRFYNDYKRGKWESMMFDLHFASLNGNSNDPIPDDAYEFLRYINGKNEDHIKSEMLDRYRAEGRNAEIRKIFHDTQKLEQSITHGAYIHLPEHIKPPKKKPVQTKVRPRPYVAPLDHQPAPKKRDPKNKHWTPDDI